MEKDKKRITTILFFLLALLLWGCAPQGAKTAGISGEPIKPGLYKHMSFPIFELPIPQSEPEKNYIGLSGVGNFKVGQIKAQVLIIEVFNFYCPHCQHAAPRVNELYQEIQGRSDMKEKIKIIGIGIGNSPYEVNSFREKYQVPFPLFSDQSMAISKMLGVIATPTFIGVKVNDKGSQEYFYFKAGGFDEDARQFLAEIIKLSGLE
jgi:thiol-disulfide isomerase/thioredoxin